MSPSDNCGDPWTMISYLLGFLSSKIICSEEPIGDLFGYFIIYIDCTFISCSISRGSQLFRWLLLKAINELALSQSTDKILHPQGHKWWRAEYNSYCILLILLASSLVVHAQFFSTLMWTCCSVQISVSSSYEH